ncbi:hypothetical protein ABK040_000784 [Willaertia magna]
MPSAELLSRVHRKSLLNKVVDNPKDLVNIFKNGMYLGWSGFTGVGYPKITPVLLADHVEQNNLQGKLKFNLFVGASTGAETENRWAKLDMIDRRYPHQVGKDIQKGINEGRIRFADQHLSMFPQNLVYGFYTKDRLKSEKYVKKHPDQNIDIIKEEEKLVVSPYQDHYPEEEKDSFSKYYFKRGKQLGSLDVTIIEATEIMEDGSIVLGASVGATPELIQIADKVIIEVNTKLPSFYGLHDVLPPSPDPPFRLPYLLTRVDDRIGSPTLSIDTDKVVAIVESTRPDNTTANTEEDETTIQIARNLIEFLRQEIHSRRIPKNLHPLQSGIGNIANSIIGELSRAPELQNVQVYTEVLQDTFLDFFDGGKLDFASATSVRFSPQGFEKFYQNWDQYAKHIMLRPQIISNSPEIIRRLGVIAMNTPVEIDIYGHANSTCVNGSRMLNGLGGSGDFLRNAKISIMHTPSARPSKTDPTGISCIVPFCSHIDHTEHDVDVYVTEQGVADLRGLSPRERVKEIIENCAHPDYKPILREYYRLSEKHCQQKRTLHEPHMLNVLFKMHLNLEKNGTMKIDNWD